MKYIILIVIIYMAYRVFSGQPLLGKGKQTFISDQEQDDPDYVDYEELD